MLKNRLKQIRLTMLIERQADMALLLDLRQEAYNRYENNKVQPTLEVALKIAEKLSLHVENIFYLDGE